MISEKVAVIDDDARVIRSLELGLKEHEIIAFQCGREALRYLRQPNPVNIVLLDVMMPGINGLRLLEEIKGLKRPFGVIMMTGYCTKEVLLQALRSRADDFIEKPFDMDDLRAKIQSLLREKFASRSNKKNRHVQIERIKRFIERNYSHVTLDHIANELCLSPKYISRIFNEKTDSTFRDYKIVVKIDRAKELLKDTKLSITQIGLELGYQNPESFMRIFKRVTGTTPSQYRKNLTLA